jgi:hypothetical protein
VWASGGGAVHADGDCSSVIAECLSFTEIFRVDRFGSLFIIGETLAQIRARSALA